MPLHFSLEPGRRYFMTRFEGQIDDTQLFEYYDQVYLRPELQPPMAEFVDLSEGDLTRVTTRGLEELAQRNKHTLSKLGIDSIKTAVYSPNNMPFGLGRVYQAWSDTSPELVRVFRDRQEAIDWLFEGAAGAPADFRR